MSNLTKTPDELQTDQSHGLDLDIVARCEQAEENLQFTQFAIDNFWDAIIWTKADGSINYVNDTACRLLNYSRPELVARTMAEIIPSLSTETWSEHWKSVKQYQPRIFEAALHTSDGQPIPVRISANYMALKGKEYNCFLLQNLTDQEDARENLLKASAQLEQLVTLRTASLTEEIEGREKIESMLLDGAERIQNILDSAGQGFLTFGKDLVVDLECSQECRIIFGSEVWGRLFPELLYPDDDKQREFLTSVLNDVFEEDEIEMHDVFLSLLPTEVLLEGNRFIEVMYRKISGRHEEGRKLMAILTDVTETKRLIEQVEEEKRTLKMVVRAVVQNKEVIDSLKEYDEFCVVGIGAILGGPGSIDDKLYEIFRRVHTFKGTFSQLDMTRVVPKLNRLETGLSKLRHDQKSVAMDGLDNLLTESNMRQWVDDDLSVLRSTLGGSFFDREQTLDIKSSQITEIEDAMRSLLPPRTLKQMLPRLKRLRFCSFKQLLRNYPEYLERLSAQLQKPIAPLTIEGEDLDVDPGLYRDLAKTMVHVFRNVVDHGIEPEETRLARGKDPWANVKCRVTVDGQTLSLEISDDGGGIDIEKIKQAAVSRGVLGPEAARGLSREDLLKLVFENEVSVRETPSEYSGRGMGLSAVKEELDKLGGQVQLRSEPGLGTTFIFSVPIADPRDMPHTSPTRLLDTIIERASRYMQDEMHLTIKMDSGVQKAKLDHLNMDGIVALIRLQGTVAGLFAMSFDYGLAKYLVRKFAFVDLTEEEEVEYLADTVGEITNIVIGSTLNALPSINSIITISTPTTCTSTGTSALRFEGSEMLTSTVETDHGKFSMNLLMSDEK